jgi:ATP adenylyltransferase
MALSWDEIHSRKAKILDELFTINTTAETIHDKGIDFVVRIASSLAKKPPTTTPKVGEAPFDPFENPPSQKLFGGAITPTHSFVFNKFNLVEDHMVIVTNHFESQSDPLNLNDMEAVWKCLVDLGGMGFFNGGRLAGASQPHKHLQFLPTPLVAGSSLALPIESILLDASYLSTALSTNTLDASALNDAVTPLTTIVHPRLPFYNLFSLIPENIDVNAAPAILLATYHEFLRQSQTQCEIHGVEQPYCFNLLILKKWLLFVPRPKECLDNTTISINSMGFAGTLFVKSPEHFETVKQLGPMGVLQALTLPVPAKLSSLSLNQL